MFADCFDPSRHTASGGPASAGDVPLSPRAANGVHLPLPPDASTRPPSSSPTVHGDVAARTPRMHHFEHQDNKTESSRYSPLTVVAQQYDNDRHTNARSSSVSSTSSSEASCNSVSSQTTSRGSPETGASSSSLFSSLVDEKHAGAGPGAGTSKTGKHQQNHSSHHQAHAPYTSSHLLRRGSLRYCGVGAPMEPQDIMLGWRDLNVLNLLASSPEQQHVLQDVSGFVVRGGITGIIGGSASGKSLLMKALTGRIATSRVSGEVYLEGQPINVHDVHPLAYVPQDDTLIGELTLRETLSFSLGVRCSVEPEQREARVEQLAAQLGLSHVLDSVIGTTLRRGMSGGEKRRTMCGTELIGAPKVLCLDEPTSGLDAASAYAVILAVKQLCQESHRHGQPQMGCIISIHQPNQRILDLFDHLLVLGRQGSVFFGTVRESSRYFASIGFPVPDNVTPSDHFLSVVDSSFVGAAVQSRRAVRAQFFDFPAHFLNSAHGTEVRSILHKLKHSRARGAAAVAPASPTGGRGAQQAQQQQLGGGRIRRQSERSSRSKSKGKSKPSQSPASSARHGSGSRYGTSFCAMLCVLVHRGLVMGYRDLTLYWCQLAIHLIYSCLVGGLFWEVPIVLDGRLKESVGALVFVSFMNTQIHVFKTYHFTQQNKLHRHERANNAYSSLAYFLADALVFILFSVIYLPGSALVYYCCGFPASGFPFYLLMQWVLALLGEVLMAVISQFFDTSAQSIVAAYVTLSVFAVFGGGLFLRWDRVPVYWSWFSELSLYTQATKSVLLGMFDQLSFECHGQVVPMGVTTAACVFPGLGDGVYNCDLVYSAASATCVVSGREVLRGYIGLDQTEDKWVYFGWTMLMLLFYKALLAMFLWQRPADLYRHLQNWHRSILHNYIIANTVATKRLQRIVDVLQTQIKLGDARHHAAERIQACWRRHVIITQWRAVATQLLRMQRMSIPAAVHEHDSVQIDDNEPSLTVDRGTDTAGRRRLHGVTSEAAAAELNVDKKSWECSQAQLRWNNLSVRIAGLNKTLLHPMSGVARGGRVLGIMGPSGSGKTTLLNALGGRASYAQVVGDVTYNGMPLSRELLSYVPQFADLAPLFTVRETLAYAMRLEVDGLDPEEVQSRVTDLLHMLGLLELAEQRIASLSGGQLKRISIAQGLVTNPAALFIDEPTSGTDSAAALNVMQYIRHVAHATGVVCLVTIHQPCRSVFNQLDDLLLLSRGQEAYFGEVHQTTPFFTSVGYAPPADLNPADWFLDSIIADPDPDIVFRLCQQQPEQQQEQQPQEQPQATSSNLTWGDLFASSPFALHSNATIPSASSPSMAPPNRGGGQHALNATACRPTTLPARPSELSRFRVLTERMLLNHMRDTDFYLNRLLVLMGVALYLGTLFIRVEHKTENVPLMVGAIFFNTWFVVLAVVASVSVFAENRRQTRSEYLNGFYCMTTHVLAQTVAALPFHIVTALAYQAIFHYLINLNDDFTTMLYFVVANTLILSFMEDTCQTLTEVLENPMISVTAAICVAGALLMYPGFFVLSDNMPTGVMWLSYIAPTRYLLTGATSNVLAGQMFYDATSATHIPGDTLLHTLLGQRHGGDDKWEQCGILLGFSVAAKVLYLAVLKWRVRGMGQGPLTQKLRPK